MEYSRLEVGVDLFVVVGDYADLKEQDVNAQVMKPAEFERLTENIRTRGALESLPYCCQPGGSGDRQIVSGHHRVRAGRCRRDQGPLPAGRLAADPLADRGQADSP